MAVKTKKSKWDIEFRLTLNDGKSPIVLGYLRWPVKFDKVILHEDFVEVVESDGNVSVFSLDDVSLNDLWR